MDALPLVGRGNFASGLDGSFRAVEAFRVGALFSVANGGQNRIQTWALEEARRRLEAEGILEDPEKKQ